ncbi:MAG: OmpA family protein [Rhodobacter sp.]|nr:OmpA family protein [Rhodobacter sp.]
MRLSAYLPAFLAFVAAALASIAAALLTVGTIEQTSLRQLQRILQTDGQEWTQVSVNGLQVTLRGTAPDEATRFRAISLAGEVVDGTRVIDEMQVDPGEEVAPPRFSIEILRNDAGISLIGLVPGAMDRAAVASTITALAGGTEVTDLLEAADYPVPQGWSDAMRFALDALGRLPRSKISVAADRVEITAISDSGAQKRELERTLTAAAPQSFELSLDISAPRPVITPFTLRFLIDETGGRFDACSAHTEDGRARILAAAAEAGLQGAADCTLGLGVPSPRWPDAVSAGIDALAELGGGSITYSDADVALVALDTTEQALFDKVVGELEAALPDVFSLHSVLPEPVKIDGTGEDNDGPPEFLATLSPEGLLQLRGRITDDRLRGAVEGFARARFGAAEVNGAMRLDEDLPGGWATRVFAAVESLSLLSNGSVVVQPDFLEIRGTTGNPDAKAEISRILSGQLGGAENFAIEVTYKEALDPVASLPTPEECVEAINAILTARKIAFAPGSAEIASGARGTIDRIAEVMRDCTAVPMEIAGHTDSQGRESMNLSLSQERAQAVLVALQARRVLTGNLTAKGYGEAAPIADNGTEDGREANRRIEFTLRLRNPETGAQDTEAAATEDGEAAGEETAESAEAAAETDTEATGEQN